MAEEFLRLGVDPTPAQKGIREYRKALDEGGKASDDLANKVESNAKRETSIYRRAAAERLQLERQLASRRTSQARVSATAAAEAFVRAQESYYQTNIARIKAAQARGLMSPADARTAGQQAALEYNNAVLSALDRPQYAQDRRAFTTLAGSIKNVGESGRSAGVGMHRLNNSLIVLARNATGAHPVVGQLTDVVGTFAIGTAAMVPILAGIAAIAGGFHLITKEARDAKEELEEAKETLEDIADERRAAAAGGEAAYAAGIVEAEIARLHNEIDVLRERAARAVAQRVAEPGVFDVQIRALQEQIQELYRDYVQPGRGEQRDEDLDDRIQRLDKLARAADSRIKRRLDIETLAAETERRLVTVTTEHEEQQRRRSAEVAREAARSRTDGIEEELEREVEARRRAEKERAEIEEERAREERRRLRELERDRRKSLRNLIMASREVGNLLAVMSERYIVAGEKLFVTTDNMVHGLGQLISIGSAVIDLERAVGFREGETPTGTDALVGYGTAALTGAGFGASTGSPALGAIGGAASGFTVAGPAGAIVGGVSGIITGLMEQGRRARLAAAQWKIAFRDFELMFADLTPLEQSQHQLDQAFARMVQQAASSLGGGAAAGITTVEQARQLLATGVSGIPGLSEDFIAELERLVRQYDTNSQMLGENTTELRNLTSALNAPSGFRQSYYRWLAQGVLPVDDPRGLPPTGGGGGGGGGPDRRRGGVVYEVNGPVTFHVQGTTNPKETAEEVVRTWEREMTRGGPGPLQLTAR